MFYHLELRAQIFIVIILINQIHYKPLIGNNTNIGYLNVRKINHNRKKRSLATWLHLTYLERPNAKQLSKLEIPLIEKFLLYLFYFWKRGVQAVNEFTVEYMNNGKVSSSAVQSHFTSLCSQDINTKKMYPNNKLLKTM